MIIVMGMIIMIIMGILIIIIGKPILLVRPHFCNYETMYIRPLLKENVTDCIYMVLALMTVR